MIPHHPALAIAAAAAASTAALADIRYTISGSIEAPNTLQPVEETHLNLTPAPDLDGADFEIIAHFNQDALYTQAFGLPAALANEGTTLRIANAQNAALDGLYTIGPVAFLPTFAALFAHPATGPFNATKHTTIIEVIATLTNAPGSANATVGQPIELDDFTGATGSFFAFNFADVAYDATNVNTHAELIPAPGVTALAAAGLALATRRRRSEP